MPGTEELKDFTGIFRNGKSCITIVLHQEQLMARLTGQTFLPIFPHESKDRFFYKVVPAELQFHRDKQNRMIQALTLHQNGRELTFRKSPDPVPTFRFPNQDELKGSYVGTYQLPDGSTFVTQIQTDTLYVKLAQQPFLPVFETREHWFEYDPEVVQAAIEFETDTQGKVIALKLHQNGAILRAEKKL